jgi:hypothetical protein
MYNFLTSQPIVVNTTALLTPLGGIIQNLQ